MTDAMQTIREALEWYADPKHYANDDWDVHSVIQPPEYGEPGKIARAALTTLDSLAVAPSEDARIFLQQLFSIPIDINDTNGWMEKRDKDWVALIQARDEWIRRERDEIIGDLLNHWAHRDKYLDFPDCVAKARSILTPEATDGQ